MIMKTTTTSTKEVTYFDLESVSFLDNNPNIHRAGGKTFLNMFRSLGIKVSLQTTKCLRTKVKKGCGKGKTRVSIYNVKEATND